jgi:hypothetical protein
LREQFFRAKIAHKLAYIGIVKRKRANKTIIVLGVVSFVIVLLAVWMWKERKSETPVRFERAVAGNSFLLTDGRTVKLMGVAMSDDQENENLTKEYLTMLLQGKNIWIETVGGADRVWVGCESSPKYWAFRKTGENPVGCREGVLVNDQINKVDRSFSLKLR